MDESTCINCGSTISGKYCSECGQRAGVKRLTFREGWNDFWARIYGFDGMFPRTLRDLTLRPGYAARLFIDGNRSAYYGPVGYFFLMITLFLLLLGFINVDFFEFMKGMKNTLPIEQKETQMSERIQRFAADNIKLMAFLVIPFQALTARYIVFRKSGYNYLENSVLPFYTLGHLYWFSMVLAIYYKITGTMPGSMVQIIFSILYIGFAYTSFIDYQSKLKTFLKGILLYLISQVFMIFTVVVVVLIWILLLAWLDPESLKMFKS